MKLKTVILAGAAMVFFSCLQTAYNDPLLDYTAPGLQDVSARFSSSGGNDMLIVNLAGGVFKDVLAQDQFALSRDASPVILNKPIRDGDTLTILNFASPLTDGSYTLTIKQGAFKEAANRVSVRAVRSGAWTEASGGGFGTSAIWDAGYGSGKFVAVGEGGKMAYSADGASWTAINPGYSGVQSKFNNDIRGVAWGDGKFIAVGYEARMASSDNGMSWNGWNESLVNGASLLCVAYGGGKFVAAGDNGQLIFLRDGGTWTKVNDSDFGGKTILALAYGNGVFVAAGADGTLSRSTNDYDWLGKDSQFKGSAIRGIAWGAGTFVAVGDEGKISTSQDGENWTALPSGSTPFGTTGILSVSYGAGIFTAAGHNGKTSISADGVTWTAAAGRFTGDEQVQTVCYGGGKFVTAGNQYEYLGGAGKIVYGYQNPPVEAAVTDVVSSPFNSAVGDNYLTITLVNGKFADTLQLSHFKLSDGTAGFASLYGGVVQRESDTRVTIARLSKVSAPGNGQRITIAAAAMRVQGSSASAAGGRDLEWSIAPGGNAAFGSSHIRSMAYGGGKYIAVGAGKIASSPNGVNWTEITNSEKAKWTDTMDYIDFYGIAYGGGKFVAVGYWVNGGGNTEADRGKAGWGAAAVSDNGTTWTITDKILTFTDESISPRIYGITYGGNRFVALGRWGRSAWSADGSAWTAVQIEPFDSVDALSAAYGDGKFVAGGGNGKLAFSTDGTDWKWVANKLLGDGVVIRSVGFGNGTFIAAGDGGNMKIAASGGVVKGTGTDGGDNWTGADSKFDDKGILGLAFGGGKYTAVGHNGRISQSEDGENWTVISAGSGPGQSKFNGDEQVICVVYGSKFVAGGNAYTGNASKIVYSD